VIVGEDGMALTACPVDVPILRKFLTDMGDLRQWAGDQPAEKAPRSPEAWGDTVISRGHSGEVLMVDPELFWDRIYRWFRSRGVDYDSQERSTST
jgi:hypothetical protein